MNPLPHAPPAVCTDGNNSDWGTGQTTVFTISLAKL